MREARKVCLHQAFRASFTLAAAGYIAARNAEPFGDLALGQRRGCAKPVAQADDLALARGQCGGECALHGVVAVVLLDCAQPFVLAADHILQGEGIAVAVGFERVGQRQFARRLALVPEVHEQLVLDALGGVGGKADALVRAERADCFDQPDGADRDQVVLLGAGGVVFF